MNVLAQALYELFSATDGKCGYFKINIELQIFNTGEQNRTSLPKKLVIRLEIEMFPDFQVSSPF